MHKKECPKDIVARIAATGLNVCLCLYISMYVCVGVLLRGKPYNLTYNYAVA